MNLDFWVILQLIGVVQRVTGKFVFSDSLTTEDWGKLFADPEFIEVLKKIFGENE